MYENSYEKLNLVPGNINEIKPFQEAVPTGGRSWGRNLLARVRG